ncbi:MarR family transcriptional regulator [Streptomonospora nanhaiensis]|uniref:MarR family transcriptional regulator n=1 Tax=Streptomonospora nanhaiensis TaxID=1323731 RepID=A0ABY6YVV1_9ACTN|nr:MarR family transcriptional regulator [Streptomonospora nanhaiensis]WAE76323.1 MarR family transcriptional regulator [Streptomonospora nanhaiensis]
MNVHERTNQWSSETVAASPMLAVIAAARVLESQVNEALSSVTLSLARLALLHRLADSTKPVGLKDLAEALGCSKSNASVLADRMLREGYLTRETDPADRRGVLLSLTPAGAAAHAAGFEVVARQQDEVFADVAPRDCDTLLQVLGQVTR